MLHFIWNPVSCNVSLSHFLSLTHRGRGEGEGKQREQVSTYCYRHSSGLELSRTVAMGGVEKCVWEQHREPFPTFQTTYGMRRDFGFIPD